MDGLKAKPLNFVALSPKGSAFFATMLALEGWYTVCKDLHPHMPSENNSPVVVWDHGGIHGMRSEDRDHAARFKGSDSGTLPKGLAAHSMTYIAISVLKNLNTRPNPTPKSPTSAM